MLCVVLSIGTEQELASAKVSVKMGNYPLPVDARQTMRSHGDVDAN